MPTYDYRCRKCSHEWELFQSIKAAAIKKCPACKKQSAQRVIGAGAGILFRGSGFYLTDYRSEGYKKAAAADKQAADSAGGGDAKGGAGGGSDAKGGGGTKSDSKPASSASE